VQPLLLYPEFKYEEYARYISDLGLQFWGYGYVVIRSNIIGFQLLSFHSLMNTVWHYHNQLETETLVSQVTGTLLRGCSQLKRTASPKYSWLSPSWGQPEPHGWAKEEHTDQTPFLDLGTPMLTSECIVQTWYFLLFRWELSLEDEIYHWNLQ
jgi:hypothetical protein